MTILTRNEGPGAKSLIVCDNCGEQEYRLTCTCKKSKLHFCDSQCKIEYQTNRKRGAYIKLDNYFKYRTDRGEDRKDAKLLKQNMVKKRCITCGRIYYGPPGNFPKSRDPNKPEPGLCEACSKRIPYDEGETAGVVM
ncbi:hypothetical protein ES703_89890 [subsurface metagenome]